MSIQCPSCAVKIPNKNIDLAANTAICLGCNTSSYLSDLIREKSENDFFAMEPVKGVSIEDRGNSWAVTVVFRNILTVTTVTVFLTFFFVFISDFFNIFQQGADNFYPLFGKYFDKATSQLLIMATYAVVFGVFWFCKTKIICNDGAASIFFGIGRIGSSRSFNWSEVYGITVELGNVNYGILKILGADRYSLAWLAKESQLDYIHEFLRSKVI